MRKSFRYLFIVIAIVIAGYFIVEHVVLVAIAKTALKYVVAMDTHMNNVSLNPMTGCITIKGFKIYNPPGFKERLLADIPLIAMDFKARTLLENGVFFDKIVVNIKKINVIKNKENETNVSKMKAFTAQEKPKEKVPFLVDQYDVKIDKIKVTDYTQGDDVVVNEVDLDLAESYKKVRNPDNVVNAIGFKLYFNGKLKNVGFNMQKIQKELTKLAEENKKLKEEFKKATQEKIEKTKEVAKEGIDATKKAIRDTTEGVKTKAGETTKAISEQTEKAKEAIKGAMKTVKEKAAESKEVVEKKVEDVKEALKKEGEVKDE